MSRLTVSLTHTREALAQRRDAAHAGLPMIEAARSQAQSHKDAADTIRAEAAASFEEELSKEGGGAGGTAAGGRGQAQGRGESRRAE
eukprot:scaffold297206_cov44-Prasinocladus_malaysianus.AAC.1